MLAAPSIAGPGDPSNASQPRHEANRLPSGAGRVSRPATWSPGLVPYSVRDPDTAAAVFNTGGRVDHPGGHIRARDLLRQPALCALGKDLHRSTGRTVAEDARVDDGPLEVASAEHLLAGALVLEHRAHANAGEEPRAGTEEVTLGGVTIPAGEMVFPVFAIANRDPSVFPDPDDLDITRPPGAHVGFGVGVHHCLGAQLARIELQEAFRGLLGRLPGLRLATGADELRYKEKMAITSVEELPVTWDS